jgi:hypothetical protein
MFALKNVHGNVWTKYRVESKSEGKRKGKEDGKEHDEACALSCVDVSVCLGNTLTDE